ncbi:MAG: MarR family transcriptional regulator [Bacteroidota bacterium]
MGNIDSEIKSEFVNEQHRFVTNLVYTAGWVQNTFTNELKPFGISPQQYNILRILKGAGEWMVMSELKDGLLEKAPNATRLVDKLLKKKLIERMRSEKDRRVVYVRITKEGLTLFEEINQTENQVQQALNHHITAEEAKLVNDILDKFRG